MAAASVGSKAGGSFLRSLRMSLVSKLVGSMTRSEQLGLSQSILTKYGEAASMIKQEVGSAAPQVSTPTTTAAVVHSVSRTTTTAHPVFGTLLSDMGYKRVYLTSLDKLRELPVFEKNRAFKPHRAAAIAKEKIANSSQTLPGVISCCEFAEDSQQPVSQPRVLILDGQHRRGALRYMADKKAWNSSEESILVEVFPVSEEKQAKDLFVEINRAEPIRLVDLPDQANEDIKKALEYAASELEKRYPAMFKLTSRCRIPHVYSDALRDDLFQSGLLDRLQIKTGEECLEFLLNVNQKMSEYSDSKWAELIPNSSPDALATALAKARANKFFLGMDKAWMLRW